MISYMLTETPSKIHVDARSGNEFNERNVAADNPNSLAIFFTQEIHTCNEAVYMRHL